MYCEKHRRRTVGANENRCNVCLFESKMADRIAK